MCKDCDSEDNLLLLTEIPEMRLIMKLLKSLLDVSFIFIFIKSATGDTSLPGYEINCHKDAHSIKLREYNINLTAYTNDDDYKNTNFYKTFKSYIDEQRTEGNFIFHGESMIYFQCLDQVHKICLHAQNLKIDETAIKIVYRPDGITDVTYIPNFYYNKTSQIVSLHLNDALQPSNYIYRLIMKFVGNITNNDGGFVKTSYINNNKEKRWTIVAADFQGVGARQIFPCWDEPNIRTVFTISIKHNRNYTALSNSPIKQKIIDDDGMIWTRFKTTDEISPYHVAIVLSDLKNIPDMNVNVWCRGHVEQQINFTLDASLDAMAYLKRIYDVNLPRKIDVVIIPNFRDKGLESWGLALYRETAVLYDEKLDSAARRFEVAHMVSRKMVHQLFGNLVGQSWWTYLWLNEGIASYLAMRIVRQFQHFFLPDLLTVQLQCESFRLNDYYDMPLVTESVFTSSDVNSLFSFTYYVKAPLLVRMLAKMMSVKSFNNNLNLYLTKYQLKSLDTVNNTIDLFFNILQNNTPNLKDINITEKFTPWIKQKGYPTVLVTRNSLRNRIEIRLSPEYNKTYHEDFWICVSYTTESSFDIIQKKWLSSRNPIFYLTNIHVRDWIIVNVQQTGYYRVFYDVHDWQKLAKYLNSHKYLNIHVLNRAQIIDDAYYFLLNHKLDLHLFKNLTYYLSNEINYIAWYPMFKIMEDISGFFLYPKSMEIKVHFRKILENVLSKIGYKNSVREDDFIKCLRQEAAKWACTLSSRRCLTAAFNKLKGLYRQPEPILPWWKEWIHCKGMMIADNDTWDKVYNETVTDDELLKFLACSENSTIIIEYINRLKMKYFTEAKQHITVFHSIVSRHAKNDLVLDHILNNFNYLISREIKAIVAITDIINHVYSADAIDKIYNCAQNNFSDEIFSDIVKKINKRSVEINKHFLYFNKFLK